MNLCYDSLSFYGKLIYITLGASDSIAKNLTRGGYGGVAVVWWRMGEGGRSSLSPMFPFFS